MKLSALFSNRFEVLYEMLKDALVMRRSLSHRILVPDRSTERFLQGRLSQDIPMELFTTIQVCSLKAAFAPFFSMQLLGYKVACEPGIAKEEWEQLVRLFGSHADLTRTLASHIAERTALSVWWGIEAKETVDAPLAYAAILQKCVARAVGLWRQHQADAPCEHAGAISLFAFSSLNPASHRFFSDLSEKIPVDYYVLSPCLFFWSDVCSDGEAKKIEWRLSPHRPHVDIEGLLFDRHPLLANSGMLGKHFARALEESVGEVREAYVLPSPPFDQPVRREAVVAAEEKHSLLRSLQTDILLLQGKRKEPITVSKRDSNIEVVGAPTLLREVEVLYRKVQSYARSIQETPRIVVLAKEMEKYVPYLYRVFGTSEELPLWIDDRVKCTPRPILSSFLPLLEHGKKRWGQDEIIALFQCAAFRRKGGFEPEVLSVLSRAFRETHLAWEGAEELVESFAPFGRSIVERGYTSDVGDAFIDVTTTEILACAFHTIRSLFSKSTSFPECGLSLNDWVNRWRDLLAAYFLPDHTNPEEIEDYRRILEAFGHLEKMTLADTVVDVDYATRLLVSAIEEQMPHEMPPQKGVLCSTFGQLQAVPASLVCLIGMEQEMTSSLLEWGYLYSAPDLVPSHIDKQFFLDAILSARDGLFISYQSVSQEDRTPIEPVSVVQGLLQALDDAYSIEGEPPSSALRSYESIDVPIVGTKSLQAVPRSTPPAPDTSYPHIVELAFLREVARSPLQPYFRTLGIELHSAPRLRRERCTLGEWEVQAALKGASIGAFASPIWERAAHLRVEEAKEALRGACRAWGAPSDTRLTFEFSLQCQTPHEVAENHFLFPAITVDISTEGGTQKVSCVGRVDDQLEMGYLCFGNSTLGTMAKQLPDILYSACAHFMLTHSPNITCFFVKDQKTRSLALTNPVATLGTYVRFAYACQTAPLCLYPDWVEPLFQGKAFSDSSLPENCPYRELLFQREGESFFHAHWPCWQKWAYDLLADLAEEKNDVL